jgi:GNAT superfamily N-acetyltransferase
VHVRLLQPDDGERLIDLFRRLSPESRYYRFHVPVTTVADEELVAQLPTYLDVDDRNHVALAGVVDEEDRGKTIIAVARFRRQDDSNRAEVAIVVRDDWQGYGVGRELIAQAVEAARAVGIKELIAWVHYTNRTAQYLMSRLPYRFEHHPEQGEDYVVVHLDHET